MANFNHRYSQLELSAIHEVTLRILSTAGVVFESQPAVDIFSRHGFPTDGQKVFFPERKMTEALAVTVDRFKLHARDPEKSIIFSTQDLVFAPTGGAPNINRIDGYQRSATMEDFERCCQLVQTSDVLDLGGYLMVQPNDVPTETAYLDMLATYIKMCEKPISGATCSGRAAKDTLEMAGIVLGGMNRLSEQPAVIAVVSANSLLSFPGSKPI